ncbi:hypothetical protein QYF36_015190 [Acer negundo]|nr:hypothetical protein QYF36_015190 [Acer negundo]
MALHTASILPSTVSICKEGKSNSSLKETGFFGVSLSSNLKAEFSSSLISRKNLRKKELPLVTIKAQTATTSPAIKQSAPEEKKTLRKGNVIVTGASSGLGLATAKSLAETGKWHVIMACRNFLKAEKAAKSIGIPKENYTVMHLDLASFDSVRQFVDNFKRSADGFELSVGTNHLGHFLLSRLLLEDLKQSDYPSKRLIIVGSITGNTNTLAGNVPPKANLGDLRGFFSHPSKSTSPKAMFQKRKLDKDWLRW